MFVGPVTATVADADEPASAVVRAALREILVEPVEQLRHDLDLVASALDGPDPEHALSLLVDVARECPRTFRRIEGALAAVAERRAAA